jgi:hypothetical protein
VLEAAPLGLSEHKARISLMLDLMA